MAGPTKLKIGGMVEGLGENVLAKEFFGSVKVDRGQVGWPQVPLLGCGDDLETPYWACRTSGQEIAHNEVSQCLQGGQGQVGGPLVPLLCHGDEVESPNWV